SQRCKRSRRSPVYFDPICHFRTLQPIASPRHPGLTCRILDVFYDHERLSWGSGGSSERVSLLPFTSRRLKPFSPMARFPRESIESRAVMSSTRSCLARTLMWVGIACAASALAPSRAGAEALLVIEAESGRVLFAQNAGYPWYPASVTKLMTAYVTLRAVKEGRLSLDTPLVVSANATAQSPVKMGFAVGTVVTVDNALKMLMVKSANDMAVVL